MANPLYVAKDIEEFVLNAQPSRLETLLIVHAKVGAGAGRNLLFKKK